MRSLTLQRGPTTEFGSMRCDPRRSDMGGLAHRRCGEMRCRARRHCRSLRGMERGYCRPCHRRWPSHCRRSRYCGRGGVYRRRGTRHCWWRGWTCPAGGSNLVWLGGSAARRQHRGTNQKHSKTNTAGTHEHGSLSIPAHKASTRRRRNRSSWPRPALRSSDAGNRHETSCVRTDAIRSNAQST